MIRVLHSVSNMDRAGIETMLMNYYRHMDRNVIQFDFICNKTKPGAYDKEITAMGGKIYHSPGLNPVTYLKYVRFIKSIIASDSNYKIVEAHNGAMGVYALHSAKLAGVPVRIFHAHNSSIALDYKWPLKVVCKSLLPLGMNKHFTCGVASAKFFFGDKVVNKGDYELIPNAIDVKRFKFNKEIRDRIRCKYGLQGKHVVGHVGRFMVQKNHIFLLKVFAEVIKSDDNARLVLLGDGELFEQTKSLAKHLGIDDKVLFVGNVENANEWYQAFDCLALPSIWEGLPVVGVEAQAADLPCIFSSRVTREIGFSDRAKFVSIDNKNKWVGAIEFALQEDSREDKSQLIAEKHYDINVEAINLQNLYVELAGGRT